MLGNPVGHADVPLADVRRFDGMAAEELAKIAGLDIKQYATEMFRSSSRLLDRSMDELFTWFKYFQAQNQKIAISQVTSVSENELSGIRDKMLRVLWKAAWHRAVCPCCSLC